MIGFWLTSLSGSGKTMEEDWSGLASASEGISSLHSPGVRIRVFSLSKEKDWNNSQREIFHKFRGRVTKPPPKRFWCNRTGFSRKVVLNFGQRFHTSLDVWMRTGSRNHPHLTLKRDHFGCAILQFNRPIGSSKSTVGINRKVW